MSDEKHLKYLLKMPVAFNTTQLVLDISNGRPTSLKGCEIIEINGIISTFRTELIEEVQQVGFSNILRRIKLNENVVAPGTTSNIIENILIGFLTKIGIDEELIIVDPYFYAHNKNVSYAKLIGNILKPFGTTLKKIVIITDKNKTNTMVKSAVEKEIAVINPCINIIHNFSGDYHDRFWITAGRSTGILTGSSLNGLGNKYALIERLASQDVIDIVSSLTKAGLI